MNVQITLHVAVNEVDWAEEYGMDVDNPRDIAEDITAYVRSIVESSSAVQDGLMWVRGMIR